MATNVILLLEDGRFKASSKWLVQKLICAPVSNKHLAVKKLPWYAMIAKKVGRRVVVIPSLAPAAKAVM